MTTPVGEARTTMKGKLPAFFAKSVALKVIVAVPSVESHALGEARPDAGTTRSSVHEKPMAAYPFQQLVGTGQFMSVWLMVIGNETVKVPLRNSLPPGPLPVQLPDVASTSGGGGWVRTRRGKAAKHSS